MITRAARTLLLISSMVVAPYIVAQSGRTIPSGAEIKVRTDQAITADPASVGRTFTATVSQDVTERRNAAGDPVHVDAEAMQQFQSAKIATSRRDVQ